MRKMLALFKASYREIKSVRCITITAMFGAISVAIGSLTIMVTQYLKIGFTFLPNQFVYYLFGPVIGGVYGAAIDILVFILKPSGVFHPGFTFNAMLTGVIHGFILYKRPVSLKRIITSNAINMVIVNFCLTTYWITQLTGSKFFVIFPPRAIKSLIMLPIESILLFSVLKGVEATGIINLLNGKKS